MGDASTAFIYPRRRRDGRSRARRDRLAGCSYPWPTSIHGHALLHLASFPAAFIRSHVAGLYIAHGLSISVFTPYITSGEQRFEEAMDQGGRVVVHWSGNEPRDSPCAPIGPLRICAGMALRRAKHLTELRKLVDGPTGCRMTNRETRRSSFSSTTSILIRQPRHIKES